MKMKKNSSFVATQQSQWCICHRLVMQSVIINVICLQFSFSLNNRPNNFYINCTENYALFILCSLFFGLNSFHDLNRDFGKYLYMYDAKFLLTKSVKLSLLAACQYLFCLYVTSISWNLIHTSRLLAKHFIFATCHTAF